MTKQQFDSMLRQKLNGLPAEDIERSADFYAELIEDRMEEGMSEEEAVAALGDAAEIAAGILADTPIQKLIREKVRPKRKMKAWEIVLLVLGSPLWISMILAAVSCIAAVYICLWTVVIAFYAAAAALLLGFPVGICTGIYFMTQGKIASGFFMIGAGICAGGLAVFVYFLSNAAAKGVILLTKTCARAVKKAIIGKEKTV